MYCQPVLAMMTTCNFIKVSYYLFKSKMIAKSPLIHSITFRKPSISPAYYRLIIEPGGTRIRYVIKFPLTRHNC